MKIKWIQILFLLAGVYELVLGIVFFLAPGWIFERYGVEPPNHFGYVQFPAMLLVLFGLMFLRIASDPLRYSELIVYGIGLKISYCAVAFGYQLTQGIPAMWIPWAWADLIFLALFSWAWTSTRGVSGER